VNVNLRRRTPSFHRKIVEQNHRQVNQQSGHRLGIYDLRDSLANHRGWTCRFPGVEAMIEEGKRKGKSGGVGLLNVFSERA
jgi:hypothetical protein